MRLSLAFVCDTIGGRKDCKCFEMLSHQSQSSGVYTVVSCSLSATWSITKAWIGHISAATRLSSGSHSERNDETKLVVQSMNMDWEHICDAVLSTRAQAFVLN